MAKGSGGGAGGGGGREFTGRDRVRQMVGGTGTTYTVKESGELTLNGVGRGNRFLMALPEGSGVRFTGTYATNGQPIFSVRTDTGRTFKGYLARGSKFQANSDDMARILDALKLQIPRK